MVAESTPESSPFRYLYNAPLKRGPNTKSFGFFDGKNFSGHQCVLRGRDYDLKVVSVSHDEGGKHVDVSIYPKSVEVDALWYECMEEGINASSEDQPFKVPDLYRQLTEAALSATSYPELKIAKMRTLAKFIEEQLQA